MSRFTSRRAQRNESVEEVKEKDPELSLEDFIETVVPGLSTKEYESIRSQALEKAKNTKHRWRQKGYYLVCTTCEIQHGSWIGPGVQMVGEKEDGTPILEKI